MEQALVAAHALFAERGYAEVTMDEVAAAVGVTKPLLYNYFGNKERLYAACMERAGDALVKTILETVGDASSPSEALNDGLRAFFAFLDADRDAWAVLFDETLPRGGEIAERVGDYRGAIVEQNLDECVLCKLCLEAAPAGTVHVRKLYDGTELS